MRNLILLTLAAAAPWFGCGGGGSGFGLGSGGEAAPRISAVSPAQLRVGDHITVIGSGFMTPNEGKTYLQLRGRYFDDAGAEHPYERTVEPELVGGSELRWKVWPDVVFHPEGNRLGYFLGEARVVNESLDGAKRVSGGHNVKFEVKPSLVLRVLRPNRRPTASVIASPNTGCGQMVVSSTTEDTPFTVGVEALGLMPGSQSQPLVFTWNLLLEHLVVKNGSYGTVNTSTEQRDKGTVTVVDEITNGALFSALTDASGCQVPATSGLNFFEQLVHSLCRDGPTGERQYLFKVIDDVVVASGGLKELKTRVVPPESPDGHAQAAITVSAQDASGASASLNIPLDIYRQFVIRRDATRDQIVEREPIKKIDESIQSSMLEIDVRYHESQSEHKSIDTGMSVSPSTRGNIGFIYAVDLTMAFNVDVRQSTSSSQDSGREVSQRVPPGMCITYYRQAEKVRRFARVITHGACGEQRDEGEIFVDDWQWQREVANGRGCPATSKALKPPGPCYDNCDVVSLASGVLDDFWR